MAQEPVLGAETKPYLYNNEGSDIFLPASGDIALSRSGLKAEGTTDIMRGDNDDERTGADASYGQIFINADDGLNCGLADPWRRAPDAAQMDSRWPADGLDCRHVHH